MPSAPVRARRGGVLVLTAWVLFGAAAASQSPDTSPPAQDPVPAEREGDLPVFRATANLVTVDAVVTDKDGRHVTDLTAEDFEVTYRGRRQTLQHAIYVASAGASHGRPDSIEPQQESHAGPEAAITRALTPRSARPARTIAIVVDDLALSFRSTVDVRRALRTFVDEQMEQGDLVAIVRTAGGMGALQQFTTDRRLLRAAVDRIRWSPASARNVGAFASVEPTRMVGDVDDSEVGELRERIIATGSLAAIEFAARGLRALPGRKSIVLVAAGFGALFRDREGGGQIWRAMSRMLDWANRAGVVIYPVDPRGLMTAGMTAEDDPEPRDYAPAGTEFNKFDARFFGGPPRDRLRELISTQEQLRFVAEQTGGFAVVNNNDLNVGFRRVLDDLQGYYLLGYEAPTGARVSGWEHDGVRVRVKRRGLKVRSRQGAFGPAERGPQPESPVDPLVMAALSPFAAGDLGVRLTALFGHDRASGSFVRTMLFIDVNRLTFTPGEDDRHVSEAEIAQLAIGDNGQVLGNSRRTVTLRLTDSQLQEARTLGIVYETRMPIAQPGAYQVRTAVRDTASSRLGSAFQFLELPPVRRGRLALSSVLLQASRNDEAPAGFESTIGNAEAGPEHWEVLGKPSLRIFQPGADIAFAYEIYDGTDGKTPLEARTALLRDGRVVYEGPMEAIQRPAKSGDITAIRVGGRLSLGAQMPPGSYTLEVGVRSDKKRHAAQWVDFEVQR